MKVLLGECDRLMGTALEAYAGAGIPVKPEKVEAAKLVVTVLGMVLDGDLGRVGVSGERRRRLEAGIRQLLRKGVCNGRALSCVIGHLTWAFLARRPLLSVLWQCYRFARLLGRRVGPLWPEVRAELATSADLLCLAEASLRPEWATGSCGGKVVLASDASPTGGGVVHTEVTEEELAGLAEHVEVRGGHVAPLHAAGLSEVGPGDPGCGVYGPLWELEGPPALEVGPVPLNPLPPEEGSDDEEEEQRYRDAGRDRARTLGPQERFDLIEVGNRGSGLARETRFAGGTARRLELRRGQSVARSPW
jgi:hypothetical protein